MADNVNEAQENEVSPDDIAQNGALEDSASDRLPSVPDRTPSSKRVEGFHRPPTRMERLLAWLERLPRVRLYVALLFVVWLSLTLLISVDVGPPVPGTPDPWAELLG